MQLVRFIAGDRSFKKTFVAETSVMPQNWALGESRGAAQDLSDRPRFSGSGSSEDSATLLACNLVGRKFRVVFSPRSQHPGHPNPAFGEWSMQYLIGSHGASIGSLMV